MSYRVELFDALTSIEWSQAVWRIGDDVETPESCKGEMFYDALRTHLPHGGLILDAGAGTGRWMRHLRDLGHQCIGLDIALTACRRVKDVDAGVPIAAADTRRAPIRDGAVDVVLSFGVVEHEEEGPAASLRELRRVLRPGGLLVLAVPFNNALRRLLVNRLQTYVTWRRRRAGWPLGFAEYRFSRPEIRRLLGQAGFATVDERFNDLAPPRNMGLWVDYNNLTLNPFRPPAADRFLTLPPPWATLAGALVRRVPWLVSGEIVFFATAS